MNYRNVWHGTIGADPEMFVFAGRKLLPAYEFLPDKLDPEKPVMYWDGFQAEWKYARAHNCFTVFVMCTQNQIQQLWNIAREHNSKATLSLQNVVTIPKELLKCAPEQYVTLGCKPSQNAYGLQMERIENPRELKIRVAGGHLHFGGFRTKPQYLKYIKALDSILGIWAVGAAQNIDVPLRRKYYGLAGEFRTPNYDNGYGMEYRTLSNFWLCHPRIMQLTLEIARAALTIAKVRDNPWIATEEEVVRTINNCDVDHARTILNRNKLIFDTVLTLSSPTFNIVKRQEAFQVGLRGVETAVDTDSIYHNWSLNALWDYYQVPTWG